MKDPRHRQKQLSKRVLSSFGGCFIRSNLALDVLGVEVRPKLFHERAEEKVIELGWENVAIVLECQIG